LVALYIEISGSLAEAFLGPDDDDTYSAAAGTRRTLALAGGDFLAAQMIGGLAANQNLIIDVLEQEFARPFSLNNNSVELLGQTMLIDGLPRVSVGLRGLEQIGAAHSPVTADALTDAADVVAEDVFARGADLASRAFHAAVPGVSLIGGAKSIIQSLPVVFQPVEHKYVRGWLAKTVRRLLEAAREKIMKVFKHILAHGPEPLENILSEQRDRLLDQLKDLPTDHLIESILRRFYDLDKLSRRCQQKVDVLDANGRAAAYEELQLIPGHTKSWLRWGGFGVGALNMAAPLLHGSVAGIPVHAALGTLLVVYALWVTHDHLDSPSWWRSLPNSRGVLAVL
jgi:hypothetical protein